MLYNATHRFVIKSYINLSCLLIYKIGPNSHNSLIHPEILNIFCLCHILLTVTLFLLQYISPAPLWKWHNHDKK